MATFIHGSNTSDIRLVAAMAAMGIRCDEQGAGGALVSGGSTVRVWLISDVSDCGKWKAADLKRWWMDSNFHKSSPQHPFAYVKVALWNHKIITEAVKSNKALVCIRKGESLAYLHPDCSANTEREILGQFNH